MSGYPTFLSAPRSRNRLISREVTELDAWRGARSVAQTLGSDVASELHSIETNVIARSVRRLLGFVQRLGPGSDSQHASTSGDNFAILERRARVKDLKLGMPR